MSQHEAKAASSGDFYGGFASSSVGECLFDGLKNSIADADTMALNSSIAVSKMLEGMADYLSWLAKDQIAQQEDYLEQINALGSNPDQGKLTELTTDLNTLNTVYDQQKQNFSTVRDQLSQSVQQLEQEIANIIQNLQNLTQVLRIQF